MSTYIHSKRGIIDQAQRRLRFWGVARPPDAGEMRRLRLRLRSTVVLWMATTRTWENPGLRGSRILPVGEGKIPLTTAKAIPGSPVQTNITYTHTHTQPWKFSPSLSNNFPPMSTYHPIDVREMGMARNRQARPPPIHRLLTKYCTWWQKQIIFFLNMRFSFSACHSSARRPWDTSRAPCGKLGVQGSISCSCDLDLAM